MGILMFLFSCKRSEEDIFVIKKEALKKVVIVYMSANNSLASSAYTNINQMEEGFEQKNGKLIVYAKIFGQQPTIYEITKDNSPQIVSRKVRVYNDHDASNPDIMKMIFSEVQTSYPAKTYAAILWSHATNWLPKNATVSLRSFGDDNGSKMDVQDLKYALPNNLEYLIFDACSMASTEVLYELKDKTRYILASPTEVLSVGLPYNRIEKNLFEDPEVGLPAICDNYYRYYMTQSGNSQSATFSLIKTEKLKQLAQTTRNFLYQHSFTYPDFKRTEVQRLDFDPASPMAGFDFMDFLKKNFPGISLQGLQDAVNEVVLYQVHTPNFLGKPINRFSGLSCYIPHPDNEWAHPFYRSLGWYRAAGFDKML